MDGGYCPVMELFDVIGRKWCLAVLRELSSPKRFNELLNSLRGISPRTLSKRLSELEEKGIIVRESFNEIPPRVVYSLSPSGKELVKIFKRLDSWVMKYS